MSSDYEALKRRYADEILRRMNDSPQAFLNLDSPSERRGHPAKAKLNRGMRSGSRFGPLPEPSEIQRAINAGFYDGFTFGAGDEIDAALAAIPAWFDDRAAGDVYDDELKRARAEASYWQDQHPIAYGGGAVIGSLAQPATYIPIGWVGRGAAVASKAAPLVRLAARSAAFGKAAAIDGGIYGFNSASDGLGNRLVGAGKSAALSGMLGAGIPVAGVAATKAGQAIAAGSKLAGRELEAAATAAAASAMRRPGEFPSLYSLARKFLDDRGGTIDLAQRLRNNFELLSRREGSPVANEIEIVKLARAGKGNFGLGAANEETSKRLGEAFVDPGYHASQGSEALISADRLRQYRPPQAKRSAFATTGTQSNFESRWTPGGRWQSNGHLNISGKKKRSR